MGDFRDSIDGAGALGLLGPGRWIEGLLETDGDVDVFQSNLIAGLTYELVVSATSSGGTITNGSVSAYFGASFLSSFSFGIGAPGVYSFVATFPGQHHWAVSAALPGLGAYRLQLSIGRASEFGDFIEGTDLGEAIDGAGGNDTVYGGGGNDTLSGFEGRDFLYGGDGADLITVGGFSVNDVYGGGGDDVLAIYSDVDENGHTVVYSRNLLDGGSGIDWVVIVSYEWDGRDGIVTTDLVAGFIDYDLAEWPRQTLNSIENFVGWEGNDLIYGSSADNIIDTGDGSDTVYGGGGRDRIYGSVYGHDVLYGGSGDDYIDGGTHNWYLDNDDDRLFGDDGNDVLIGALFADTLYGGTGNDTLYGDFLVPPDEWDDFGGDDLLYGGTGADSLYGGGFDDTLDGGTGNDLFDGGSGSDTVVYASNLNATRIDLVAGRASFIAAVYQEEVLISIENAEGGAGADSFIGDGADNRFTGGAGDDLFLGGDGFDFFAGGDGNDSFDGGRGRDTADGGAGVDTVTMASAAGAVTIDLLAGRATTVESGASVVDEVIGFEHAVGGSRADALIGNPVANLLRGLGGADTLTGGGAADTLIGGSGADLFRFLSAPGSAPAAPDVLRAGDGGAAFDGAGTAAGDRIDVAGIDANSGVAGNQAFVFGTATGAGRLWVAEVGTNTVVRANVNATAAWEFELVIEDGAVRASAYRAADFIL